MKKPIAILLIGLIAMNTMGYYGVFLGLRYSNTVTLNDRFDDEKYLKSQAVTFEFKISLPYHSNSEFQRVTGEIEYKGEIYHLVKQKYHNDALYIVCYRDSKSELLNRILTQYVESFGEHSTDHGSIQSVPSFIKDFLTSRLAVQASSAGWSNEVRFFQKEPHLISSNYPILSPPPEA